MSKTSSKDRKGWIEAVYGDYWSSKKELIVVGFFAPIVFSFLLLFEVSSVAAVFNIPFKPWAHFYGFIAWVGLTLIVSFTFLSIVISLLYRYVTEKLGAKLFMAPLDLIYKEIYIDKKPNQFGILEKNFTIATLRAFKLARSSLTVLGLYGILFIPGLVIGFLGYILFVVILVPNLSLVVKYLPIVGVNVSSSIQTAFASIRNISQPSWINTATAAILSISILVIMIFLFGFMNLVETNTYSRYRGNIRIVLGSGIFAMIKNLNLPNKIADFAYTTVLCFFTDQKTTSLNIPIINPKNIETAMQNALDGEQECYIARLPLDFNKILENLKKCTPEFIKEIQTELKQVSEEDRIFIESLAKKTPPKVYTQVGNTSVVCGLNDGVKAYAILQKQPVYSSRLIQILWCSDPLTKNRIIDNLQTLESQ
jgi:hypothetical protein